MTKDLATLVTGIPFNKVPRNKWLNTYEFLDAVDATF